MIEVPIPKDVMRFKTTLIGPFTSRQVVCGCVCFGLEFAVFSLIKRLNLGLTMDAMVGLGVILAAPILAFAILEPFGMPLEKYLKNVIVLGFFAPRVRVYQTQTIFDEEKKEEKPTKAKTFSASELRKHPDYVMYK